MKKILVISLSLIISLVSLSAQDLSQGLLINDLALHPMQPKAKPAYLDTIVDPSFGTTIRRITDAGPGGIIKPMYSTIQAWNADESLMIVYDANNNNHRLLNGQDYSFIRILNVLPRDIEEIFWHFTDPDILFYYQSNTGNFVTHNVQTNVEEIIVNLETISGCSGDVIMGRDIQMMSWDSDVISFRCDNNNGYAYRISTGTLTTFNKSDWGLTAPSMAPSGDRMYHFPDVYDMDGTFSLDLNQSSVEHSCMGKLTDGTDAMFAIAFAEGPDGGCIGDIIAHNLVTGECFPIISQDQGYDYPQSGTHISSVAHKNSEGGWIAASMVGYDEDGQELLDQELVIAKADQGNIKVCRIGHHRSDENEYDYWGEPHAVISPLGTRVLFGSDWSGAEDGESIDCYIVELPAYRSAVMPVDLINFNLRTDEQDIVVEWSTASEVNSDYFAIERSTDSVNWIEIGQVTASGNSSDQNDYSFTDLNVWSGSDPVFYYRLRMVDLDGSSEYSEIKSLTRVINGLESLQALSFSVFPNPSNGEFSVIISDSVNPDELLNYELYNHLGQLIHTSTMLPKEDLRQIDISNYGPGVFTINFKSKLYQHQVRVVIW